MIRINTVYQKVLALANKEQRGYITPKEFNVFADQAQIEIFEQYFYDLDKLMSRTTGNSHEYADIIDNLNEKINIFKAQTVAVGGVIQQIPNRPIWRLGTVSLANGIEVEEVQANELLNTSPLLAPTVARPVYVRTNFANIDIRPDTITDVGISFVRRPKNPRWGYFVVNNKALYDNDPSKTINFELHPSEEAELIYKILKFAGISIKSGELARVSQGLEVQQVNQEKQ